jgi:UDP-3-O-[3-hydroxymyristoyl] glucosamine N-acyltransferase
MERSVDEIAKIIHAIIFGNPLFKIKGVSSFDDANSHDITFADGSKYLSDLQQTKAGAVIVPDTFKFDPDHCKNVIVLKTNNPKASFFKLVPLFHPEKIKPSCLHKNADIGYNVKFGKNPIVESKVFIGDNVNIGDNVHLMPGVYIGDDVWIGDNTLIKPNVTLMEKTRIGNNVIIHSGTIIGSDGFGFTQDAGTHEKIIHTGYVHIGNHVEIGACNTIDRGTLGKTIIGNGVKTDNLVHIAHNVKIGENTLIVAQVGIAGSTRVGKNVIIAGKAGITGHVTIGDNAIIGPYAGVSNDVPQNQIVSGAPHMPHGRWRKVVRIISRLPEMRKALFSFEKRLKNLENK